MALDRRLDRLDQLLSTTQLVLRWLDEAFTFGSLTGYVRAIIDLPGADQPLSRLCRDAQAGSRSRFHGKSNDESRLALRGALRQTVFRYELVMRANEVAGYLADRAELQHTLFATQISMFGYMEHDADWPRLSGLVRDNCVRSVDEQMAVEAARVTVEQRYFDGHPILFPECAERSAQQLKDSQRLAVIADVLGERDGVAAFEIPSEESLLELHAQRLADLVEPARSTALDKLDEDQRAIAIAAAWNGRSCNGMWTKRGPSAIPPARAANASPRGQGVRRSAACRRRGPSSHGGRASMGDAPSNIPPGRADPSLSDSGHQICPGCDPECFGPSAMVAA